MIAVLLAKNDPTTPAGFPPEYFRDARGPVDKLTAELEALGYILVSEDDYDRIVKNNESLVLAWEEEQRSTKQQAEDQAYASKVAEIEALTAKAAAVDTMDDQAKLDAIPNILKVLGAMDETLKKLLASR